MDPNNIKALYFRGKAQYSLEEFDNAITTLTRLCVIDPNNADAR
jgi:Flp pilus assembly protein TadD